ncbi:MAG: short-chain dehydrogenase [Marinilabiliales bacterium]|nr:MAG: short-chain dehydrogenase [Marinilabiliales bacterium]
MDIIISGTSRGIGFATAKAALEHGRHRVIGISRTDAGVEDLQEIAKKAGKNATFHYLEANLGEENYAAALNRQLEVISFSPEILINNAGALIKKDFADFNKSDFEYIFRMNFWSAFFLIQNVLPHLKEGSHIVNISSMGGYQGSAKFNGLSMYAAAKAAIANLSESLAEEFKDKKISVNALCPGAVQTEMLTEAFPGFKAPVTPDEMGHFIFNFALESGKIMNGKVIPLSLSNP